MWETSFLYSSLFVSGFVSATLLPGSSEWLLLALLQQHPSAWLPLVSVATLGNTLGGMTSWYMGAYLYTRMHQSHMLDGKHVLARSKLQRWGAPTLLFSWVPVLGDPLCFMAGWLKLRWIPVLIFMGVGKAFRYGLIASLM